MLFHVIEDDKANLDVLIELVEDLGHEALGFCSAEAYLEFFSSDTFSAPAAVVTDIRMPGMSGTDLVGHIRSQRPFQRIAIITGTVQNGITVRSELCSVIPKPFRHETLITFVQAITSCENKYEGGIQSFTHEMCEFGLNHPCPFTDEN